MKHDTLPNLHLPSQPHCLRHHDVYTTAYTGPPLERVPMYQEPEVVPSAEEIESKREAIRQRKAAGESVEAIARDTGLTQMYVRRV